jgi:hypothetical protein
MNMTLEDAFFVSQIVAGVAVTLSLVYVGLQVRQNTRTTKLAAVQAVQTAMGRIEELIIEDNGFADILRRGLTETVNDLSDTDRIRLNNFYRNVLRTHQAAHYQFRNSALDRTIWDPQVRTLAAIFQADKGLRDHFQVEKYMLDPSFVVLCEDVLRTPEQWRLTSAATPLAQTLNPGDPAEVPAP